MKLAIIILNYNTKALVKKCVESIVKKEWKTKFDIWVVDNASADGSAEYIRKYFPKVNLIESKENLGFSGGNNLALKKIKADYYLLLNSDTEVQKGAIDSLVDFITTHDFQVVSCKLKNKDGSFQPNAGDLPVGMPLFSWISGLDDFLPFARRFLPSFHRKFKNYYKDGREVGWVSGTAMLIKKEVLSKAGYLDEKIFMYGEDVEFCLRVKRKGFKIGWTNRAEILHLGGGSSKNPQERQWEGEFRGLLYIYGKYFGMVNKVVLRLMIYCFTALRMIVFLITGKKEVARTYAKVLIRI